MAEFRFYYVPRTKTREGHKPKLSTKMYSGRYYGEALDKFKEEYGDVIVTKWEEVGRVSKTEFNRRKSR